MAQICRPCPLRARRIRSRSSAEYFSPRRAGPIILLATKYVRRALLDGNWKVAHTSLVPWTGYRPVQPRLRPCGIGGLSLPCTGTACTFPSCLFDFLRPLRLLFGLGLPGTLRGFELVGLRRFRLGNHAEPMLRHLLPNRLFVWVAGNSRHPLALLRVSAILIWLAHRVCVGIKASLDWNADLICPL
jgi:hypothetical protein